jgi:hypothetical protein
MNQDNPPRQLRAVVYAQKNPYEQPIPLTIEVKPLINQSRENIEFVQLTQPLTSPTQPRQP